MVARGPDSVVGRVVDVVLRTTVTIALLLVGLAAYQTWGTGVEYRGAQERLAARFEQISHAGSSRPTLVADDRDVPAAPGRSLPPARRSEPPPVTPRPDPQASADQHASTAPATFERGEPVARIEIEAIGVDEIVVAGALAPQLRIGPGLVERTALPGQLGHSLIGGHRTTYGAPFERLDELAGGDELVVTGVDGVQHRYRVTSSSVVEPALGAIVEQDVSDRALLTLFTCHPKWSTRQRLAVSAELVGRPRPPAPDRAVDSPPSRAETAPGNVLELDRPADDAPAETIGHDRGPIDVATGFEASAGHAWWRLAMWATLLACAVVGARWLAIGRPIAWAPGGCVVLLVLWQFSRAVNDVAVNGGWLVERLAP